MLGWRDRAGVVRQRDECEDREKVICILAIFRLRWMTYKWLHHTHTQKDPFTDNTSNPPVSHGAPIPFLSPLPLLILFSFTPIPPPPPVFWQLQGAVTKWVYVSYCLSRKWDFSRWMGRFWRRNAILRKAAQKRMDCYRYRLPLSQMGE